MTKTMIKIIITAFCFSTLFITHQGFSQLNQSGSNDFDFRESPGLAWKFKSTQSFFGSPLINGETVYIGGVDSFLYAFNIADGSQKWKFRTKGAIRSTVSINADHLYLVSGDGNLYCLNKNNGKINWTFATKGEKQYDPYDYFQSSPVINKGVIYFGSGDGNVYAVNETDGRLKWNYTTSNVVHGTVALSDDKLFVGSFDGNVYALNIADGSLAWKFKSVGQLYFPKGEMQFSPVIANGLVYIGGRDFNLYALDMKAGYCHWNRYFNRGWAPVITASSKNDSVIYIGTSDDHTLFALNGITGSQVWKTSMYNIFGAVATSETMCYAGTYIGKLHGLDRKTGSILWTFSTDGYNTNHDKYVKPDDSYRDDIYSIITSNEAYIKAFYTLGAIYSSPAIGKNIIVISSTDGTVYCLKKKL